MTQSRSILWLAVITATLCLLGVPAALRAQTTEVDDGHEVVITSFPDGANVWIDNLDIGKVTPMELRRISPGIHTIKVAVASPGWSSDTRTINVLTLIP
jgi:purine nucleoside permease